MVIGRTPLSSSSLAISTGFLTLSGTSIRIGAPRLICKARTPIILARSNLVSFGGPIKVVVDIGLNPHQRVLAFKRKEATVKA